MFEEEKVLIAEIRRQMSSVFHISTDNGLVNHNNDVSLKHFLVEIECFPQQILRVDAQRDII